MITKFFLLFHCLVIAATSFAQINFNYLQTDSLRQELSKAKNDSGRVLLMANLAEGYRWTSPDSAIYFGQKSLQLANQIDFPRGEAAALISISVVQRELGNLAKALDLAMKALAIAQRHQFAIEEVSALIRVANVYSAANNYDKALVYLHQSEHKSSSSGNKLYENISQWLIASAFERTNRLDSALYYADVAFKNTSWDLGTDFSYNILGDIQLKLKKDSLALNSYRIGLREAERASDYRTEANLTISLANYYKKHNRLDSAIYYAKKGLAVAQFLSYKNRIISSSSILADIYETKDPQEALKYYRIYNAAKDSLYGAEKMQALQTLMMDEQEKQKKTEAAQLAYQNRVKQFGLLGGLLFVLVILSLLYRNNRRKQKANEFLQQQKQEIEERKAQAEIETALEKVRTIAMSMRRRDDMLEICKVIARQLTLLKVQEIRNVQTAIFYQEKGTYINYEYYAKHDKTIITETSYTNHEIHQAFADQMLKGHGQFFSTHIEGEQIKDWIAYQKTTNVFIDDFLYKASSLNYYWYSLGAVATGISTYKRLTEEEIKLFNRFLKVFELAYRRYLDIEKAEAQALEARIEAALEKVRSRSLAVRQSDEFKEVINIVFEKLQDLEIPVGSVSINIFIEGSKDIDVYACGYTENGLDVRKARLNYFDHPISNDLYNAHTSGLDFFVGNYDKKTKNIYYEYQFKHSLKDLPAEIKEKILQTENYSLTMVPAKNSIIIINNFEGKALSDIEINIQKRFAAVFDQAYTRFLDLQKAEAQAREAQIEAALEKVRSRSLAMHTANELGEVVKVIVEKLMDLGVVLDANGVVLCTYFNNSKNVLHWIVSPDFSMTGSYLLPYFDHAIFNAAWQSKENGDEYFSKSFSVAEKNSFFEYAFEHSDYRYFPEEFKQWIFQNDKHSLSFAWQKNSAILIPSHTGVLPSDEDIAILKRFAKVFEQSYVRFLDLQKAEAQARESQIQLALERVRARTMAMQKSDELMETAVVLFDQLKQLGEDIERTIIGVMNEEEHVVDVWATRPDGSQMDKMQKFPIDEPVVMQKVYGAWQQQKRSIVIDLQGDELESYFQFLKSKGPRLKRESFGERRVENFAFFSKGMLGIISVDPNTPANIELYERFAAVFDQTYTRFLDLQKSEAQARESQIEAALERVRSRAMSMHTSEELNSLIGTVFTELTRLDLVLTRCVIMIYDKKTNDTRWWMANSEAPDQPMNFGVQYHEHSPNLAYLQGWKERKTKFQYVLEDKIKKDWDDFIFSHTELSRLPDFVIEGMKAPDRVYLNASFHSFGNLTLASLSPLSEEHFDILIRFAKVFDLTYTRFNDLKMAEASARESQIEAALEKVRGKAMAMHNSNDLSVTASMVFTELRKLGISPIRCGVGLLNNESHKGQLYSAASSPDGDSLSLVGWALLENHPVLERIYHSWQKGEDYFPELTGEQLKHYYELLLAGLPVNVPDWQNGQKQYGHFFSFSIGCLYAWSENPYSDDEIKIIKRFGSIIDLTFRRYMDLQKSEASTKEAVKQAALDRIRADIASMRTVGDLDRIIPLVWNELTTLGVPFIRCGVFIMKNDEQQIHTFLSTPDGKAIASFHLPYDSPGNISKVLSHWQSNEIYKDHWDDDAFREFANSLVKQGALKSSKQYLSTLPVGGFYLHFVPFVQGMLYVGNTTALTDDEIKLLRSVAEAFSTAYARYEDFNKLEGAKKQVEKTLVELKQAQTQLVQSEKMASLGELTAGIAHEIQNPLNFVNNFSEVSSELMDEIKLELDKGEFDEAKAIADDVKQNLQKIAHHGKRADAIVKSMLQHSRKSSGQKDAIDINALVDEYLRLSYHGFRAKEKSFNAIIETHFDSQIGKIEAAGQDIGRVMLNLFNNAFYALNEKIKQQQNGFEPTLQVSTNKLKESLEIKIKDNGIGMPDKVLEKIYQPFFTTKPTGEGTGLGLSLSYDIITKGHGGNLKVETEEGEGSEFIIQLPNT